VPEVRHRDASSRRIDTRYQQQFDFLHHVPEQVDSANTGAYC
jgi:hypothetical protein